ncbi:unnamed protein product [Peniophora sp. CBMAI 1063]|nr:unnamed protein product [Peniophora sp. CBMAI 1063]
MSPPLRERKLVQKVLRALGKPSPILPPNPTVPDSPPTWHQVPHVEPEPEPDSPSLLASFSQLFSHLRNQSDDTVDVVGPEPDAPQAPRADISDLPPEILAMIFKIVRDGAFPAPAEALHYDPKQCLAWTNVVAVSVKWSTIAFIDPSLWTNVPLDAPPEIIRRHFERSKGLKLRIYLSGEAADQQERASLLRQQASRVMAVIQIGRSQRFHRPSPVACHLVEEDSRGFAVPELEELSVYSDAPEYYPTGVLLRYAATLRSLAVIDSSWDKALGQIRAPQLRRLALAGWAEDPPEAYGALLQFIQANPLLEEITIAGIQREYLAFDADTQPVECKHLRRLHLSGQHEGILTVLRLFVFDPHKTIVELDVERFKGRSDEGRVNNHTLLALPYGLGRSRAEPENSRRWLHVSQTSMQAGFDTDKTTPSVVIRPSLYARDGHLEVDLFRGVHQFACVPAPYTCEALKLAGVRTLSFDRHSALIAWELYEWCTEVEVLEVALIDWIGPISERLFMRQGGHLFLPALKRVRVFDSSDRPAFGAATQSRLVQKFQGDRKEPVAIDVVWRRDVKESSDRAENMISFILRHLKTSGS